MVTAGLLDPDLVLAGPAGSLWLYAFNALPLLWDIVRGAIKVKMSTLQYVPFVRLNLNFPAIKGGGVMEPGNFEQNQFTLSRNRPTQVKTCTLQCVFNLILRWTFPAMRQFVPTTAWHNFIEYRLWRLFSVQKEEPFQAQGVESTSLSLRCIALPACCGAGGAIQ